MALVKFYRGSYANHKAEIEKGSTGIYAGGIFFATDTNEIWMDGKAYGGAKATIDKVIKTVELIDIDKIKVTYVDDSSAEIALTTLNAADSSVVIAGDKNALTVKVNVKADEAGVFTNALKLDTEKGLYVDNTALTGYKGDDKAIEVSEADASNVKTISLKTVAGDKLIVSDTTGLHSRALNLNHDAVNKKLLLRNEANEVIADLDTTAFLEDGILENVEIVNKNAANEDGTFLKFTFVYAEDTKKDPVYVNVSDFLAPYLGDNGIQINGLVIGIELDATSETYKDTEGAAHQMLSVSAEGLKLTGVKTTVDTAVNAEATTRNTEDKKIAAAVGLNADTLGHVNQASSHYLQTASTIAEETAALDSAVFGINETTINGDKIGSAAALVVKAKTVPMTDYALPAESSAIAPTDMVTAAIGKLEYRLNNVDGGGSSEGGSGDSLVDIVAKNKVSAADDSMTVVEGTTVEDGTKISVKIDPEADNMLKLNTAKGLYVKTPTKYTAGNGIDTIDDAARVIAAKIAAGDTVISVGTEGIKSTLNLVKLGTPTANMAASYQLQGVDGKVIGTTIDIPKDQFLKAASFVASANASDLAIDSSVVIGDPYLKLEWQLDAQAITYIPVKKLVDVYKAGDGLLANATDDHTFEVKVDAASEKQADGTNGFLTVSAEGIKVSGIQAAIDAAMTWYEEA